MINKQLNYFHCTFFLNISHVCKLHHDGWYGRRDAAIPKKLHVWETYSKKWGRRNRRRGRCGCQADVVARRAKLMIRETFCIRTIVHAIVMCPFVWFSLSSCISKSPIESFSLSLSRLDRLFLTPLIIVTADVRFNIYLDSIALDSDN